MNPEKRNIIGVIMFIWRAYATFVKRSTVVYSRRENKDISYWRDRLFIKFITYLLPTCLIALVPGVIMAYVGGFVFIAYADVFTATSIAVVSLNVKLSLPFKKAFVVTMLYMLSVMLIIDLSLLGPGMVYLLALSVLVTVIFPRRLGYWSVAANLLICIGCALIIHFDLTRSPLTKDYDLGTWIAVSSNMVFLSYVIVMLVGSAIKGLETVISTELHTNKELQKEIEVRAANNILLEESESHFKSLFFLNPSPMWVLDRETLQFLLVNEAAVQQYGYTCQEFLSMNIKDIKLEIDVQTLYNDLNENKIANAPITIITKHRRKSQEQFFAEVTFNTITFKTRPATLVISQDITEQVNYVQAIERQNKQFREIAWIQSHKVRGPLASILGLTQLFNSHHADVNTEDVVEGILQSSIELDTVIREIVDKTSIAQFQTIPGRVLS